MDLGADTEGETPSTSSAPSNLATKLLSLWAHGKLSAVEVQKLSNLATLDGCSHPEVATLGAAGNFGEQPGNCHRALVRSFCNQLSVPEPGLVTCKCFDPKTSKIIDEDVAIFYPHLMFGALAESYPKVFQRLFKLHELPEFWEQTLARDDDRLVNHPATLEKGWEQVTIPLFTHGDGVEYESRDSLMVWSFGPLLSQEQSLDSHLLMAAWPKSCTCKDTWPQLWKELAWSFKALAKGQHPTHDADGNPLKKGSPFWAKKGKPLASGLKAIVWCIEGDHEFFSNSLGLPHWRNASPCWNCDCTQAAGEKPYNKLHPWDQFKEVDHSWAQAFPSSKHPLLTEVPGNSSRLVRGDALHILFTKGLYGHLLGSILHYLCWYDEGAHQATKPADRLGIIFKEVQAVYTDKEVTCRLTNLMLSMFTDPKKPWANWANLSCKGGEGKHLAPCLLEVLKKHLGFQQARAQPHAQVLRACMPGGGNLGLCRNISHKSRVQEVLAIGTRCHERIPVAECMVGRLWKEFLPHSHQAPYIPTSCKRCLVFKSQSLLVLQGRRLCGSHKYCDPQCVHGCESNQDQPKTGHQVQNFITSSVHKARVSSANLG